MTSEADRVLVAPSDSSVSANVTEVVVVSTGIEIVCDPLLIIRFPETELPKLTVPVVIYWFVVVLHGPALTSENVRLQQTGWATLTVKSRKQAPPALNTRTVYVWLAAKPENDTALLVTATPFGSVKPAPV